MKKREKNDPLADQLKQAAIRNLKDPNRASALWDLVHILEKGVSEGKGGR